MIRVQRCPSISGVSLLAALVALAPGCTLFGDQFLPDQPKGEVTVVGAINIDRATVDTPDCTAGSTLFWGIAKNTGDLDVDDVFIEIDALDAGNGVLGTYRGNVFNGEVTPATEATDTAEATAQMSGTSLAVDQSGTFQVCARLGAGTVAGTAYRTDFIIVNEIE